MYLNKELLEEVLTPLKRELREQEKEMLGIAMVFLLTGVAIVSLIFLLVYLVKSKLEVEIFWILIFFFQSIFVAYITEGRSYRKKRSILKKAHAYYDAVNEILKKKEKYLLYLYDFDSGEERIEMKGPPVGGTDGIYHIDGNHRRATITKKLHKHLKIVFLNNNKELSYSYKGISVIVSDNQWFDFFKLLYSNAFYVVLDYRDKFIESKNIIKELKYIQENPKGNIIFSGTDSELEKINNQFPNIKNIVKAKFKTKPRETVYHPLLKKYSSSFDEIDGQDLLFEKLILKENL